MSNEAAERLRVWFGRAADTSALLDAALAAERRATVKEFYDRLEAIGFTGAHLVRDAMLDEEAAR